MKTFLGPKSHDGVSTQKAQGCFTTNLAMPGLGSLVGGRKVGIFQLALSFCGFAVTLGYGVGFIFWALAHWSEFNNLNPNDDPMAPLRDLWQHARWPLAGIFLFFLGWFWALLTSWSLLAEAKSKTPPQIK